MWVLRRPEKLGNEMLQMLSVWHFTVENIHFFSAISLNILLIRSLLSVGKNCNMFFNLNSYKCRGKQGRQKLEGIRTNVL